MPNPPTDRWQEEQGRSQQEQGASGPFGQGGQKTDAPREARDEAERRARDEDADGTG